MLYLSGTDVIFGHVELIVFYNVQTINLTSFVKCEISSIYIYIALCESKYQVALNIIFSLAIAISDSWISG